MRGVNKVILVGTLGRDPETKTFPNGGSVTNFSIATSEVWNDKNTGERREQTEWHRIVLNGRVGEIAQQYLRKGSKVYIEGSLRTRQWTDQTGQTRSMTEIVGTTMQLLDSRPQNGEGYSAPMQNQNYQPNNNYTPQANYGNPSFTNNSSPATPNSNFNMGDNAGNFGTANAGFSAPTGFDQGNQYGGGYGQSTIPSSSPSTPSMPQSVEKAADDLDDDLPF